MTTPHRRDFLQASGRNSLSALTAAGAADKPNEKIVLAVMGVHGRGRGTPPGFSAFDDVEIAYDLRPRRQRRRRRA